MSAIPPTDPRYIRAARLLAWKLGVDWRTLPPEQVQEYLRKIEIAQERPAKRDERGRKTQ